MASDFWSSTQNTQWRHTKSRLQDWQDGLAKEDVNLIRQYPLPDNRLLSIYLQQQIAKLGKRFQVHQPILGTAMIFVRRFYLKIQIRKTNPYLLLVTAFYLACKVEETPHHIKTILTEARHLWSDFISPLTGTLGECEFLLISEINAQLVVHHPFRPLKELQQMFSLSEEEYTLASSFINDHYATNLPFLYPPHIIAVAAISAVLTIRPSQGVPYASGTIAKNPASVPSIMRQMMQTPAQNKMQRFKLWLVESDVDVEGVIDCVQEMVSLYVIWEQYSEEECRDHINRFVKERKLDR